MIHFNILLAGTVLNYQGRSYISTMSRSCGSGKKGNRIWLVVDEEIWEDLGGVCGTLMFSAD